MTTLPPCVSENPDGTTRGAPYSPSTLVAGRGGFRVGCRAGRCRLNELTVGGGNLTPGSDMLHVGDGWRWCENEEFVVWEEDLKM